MKDNFQMGITSVSGSIAGVPVDMKLWDRLVKVPTLTKIRCKYECHHSHTITAIHSLIAKFERIESMTISESDGINQEIAIIGFMPSHEADRLLATLRIGAEMGLWKANA